MKLIDLAVEKELQNEKPLTKDEIIKRLCPADYYIREHKYNCFMKDFENPDVDCVDCWNQDS